MLSNGFLPQRQHEGLRLSINNTGQKTQVLKRPCSGDNFAKINTTIMQPVILVARKKGSKDHHCIRDIRLDRAGYSYTSLTSLYLRYMDLAREYEGSTDGVISEPDLGRMIAKSEGGEFILLGRFTGNTGTEYNYGCRVLARPINLFATSKASL